MSKLVDMTGQRFGRWTVLRRGECQVSKSGRRRPMWLCVCECGKEASVEGRSLRKGLTLSCGCFQKELVSKRRTTNLIGLRFGRLTVIEKVKSDKRWMVMWKCRCDCGREIETYSGYLKSGNTTSCGCYKSETSSKNHIKDLTGLRFGKLSVLKRIGSNKNKNSVFLCRCDCGSEREIIGDKLIQGKTTSCGCLSESFIASELKRHYVNTLSAIPEYKCLRNPKTGNYLPYDLYIPDKNIFIEVQGLHHFKNTGWFNETETLEYRQHKDRLKKQYAEQHGKYIEVDLRKTKTVEEAIAYVNSFIQ